jgi:MoaA/NifB/PqqE/SkfB family radical SAM enzyme
MSLAENTERSIVALEDNHPPKDQVLRVEWNIGKKCNFDCSYCSPTIHAKKADDLDLDLVVKTANKLVDHARQSGRLIRISLTGGEPYLHPQFTNLLRCLKEAGVDKISITSNGSLPTQVYLDSLDYIDYLIISVHFEYIRLEKLKERVHVIQSRLKKNQRLHLHVMMLPGRVEEALELSRDLKALGISYVLRRVRPQFDGEGLFLRPFQSGQLGLGHADWKKIKEQGLSYYSDQELALMGVDN